MALLNTAQFTLTDMITKRSLGDRLQEKFLSVKDFGATGNGTTDDGPAINAALDFAYGEEGAAHNTSSHLNWAVGFPRGLYRVAEPLRVHQALGAHLIGAGPHATRIFWGGDEVVGEDDTSSLLSFYTCWHTTIRGMTLDAGGTQMVCMHSRDHTGAAAGGDNGSDGYYENVHFINTNPDGFTPDANSGHLVYVGDGMGSERTYVNCRFSGHKWGVRCAHDNALNHAFYACHFEDCEVGINSAPVPGGQFLVKGCRFHNNSVTDIAMRQNCLKVVGCYSTSQNFVIGLASIVGCIHDHASEGWFWKYNDVPSGQYSDHPYFVAKSNHSTNGVIVPQVFAHLLGNTFDNTDYLTNCVGDANGNVWEDGAWVLVGGVAP